MEYFVGVDGLSILLVLLTTLLMSLALVSTWTAVTERVREFMIFFLLLEVGMIGVFLAQDLFLFYVFWEFTLVPMYFLIGMWGGERRMYAAVKFFLYTMAGSVLMLLAILWLGTAGRHVQPARADRRRATFRRPSRSGCSWPSPPPSPSRCRCGRCTRGCPTPTSKRRLPAR